MWLKRHYFLVLEEDLCFAKKIEIAGQANQRSPHTEMFNTASLFKLKEQIEIELRYRLSLRIMQMLHARLETLDVVNQMETKMAAGEHPIVPFLSYQRGSAWSDGEANLDYFGEKTLVFEEFRAWLEDSPYRLREHEGYLEGNNIHSISYLFDTVLGEMDFPELPLLYKHGSHECASAPARKLFTKGGGALVMLEAILGKGLQLKETREPIDSKTISRTWTDSYGEESEQSQTISISRVTWSIEFTGRPERLWVSPPASVIHPECLIARALAQLNEVKPTIEGSFVWPRLLTPFWKNPDMSVAIVKHMEMGNHLTQEQAHEVTLAREQRDLVDPGEDEEEDESQLCHDLACGGVLGRGGFCRSCSKKFYEVRQDVCPNTGELHVVYDVLSTKGTYAAIDCADCHFHSRGAIRR